MENIIVNNLKKYYGTLPVVDGITFSVNQGEIFGMLGPNGAGKTTAIETIIGLTKRDSGTVTIKGIDPLKNPEAVRLH